MKGFLKPESIAIIGASNDTTKIGGMLVMNLINAGFPKDKIYPINPKNPEIQGLKAYTNVTAVGKPIDLAVISIKNTFVVPEMDNLKAAGIKYAIIMTADHGGHDRIHGMDILEDMVIPMCFLGDAFEGGKELSDVSLLNLAPTIAAILGLPAVREWEGKSLV